MKLQPKPKSEDLRVYPAARLEDIPEIEHTAQGIIRVLKKFGGYEPDVDDIWVNAVTINPSRFELSM